MRPLCFCSEDWICKDCLRCVAHCTCETSTPELVHRNSKEAGQTYGRILRAEVKTR